MNSIVQFLSQIYTLLAQVHDIVKANNQFAQSIESRVIAIEKSLNCEIPPMAEIVNEEVAKPIEELKI